MNKLVAFIAAALLASAAWAQKTELTFYYPIAVGGPLTKVIDGFVAAFEKEHPDVVLQEIVGRHLQWFVPSPELIPR